MPRFEPVLVASFLAAWVVDLLAVLGVVDLRGSLELGLYPLYSIAAAAGSVAGNLCMLRGRRLPTPLRRRLQVIYLLGPPGVLFLLRAMAPIEAQRAAPLVPFYSFGVFIVFFLVPVLMWRAPSERGVDDRDGDPPVVP